MPVQAVKQFLELLYGSPELLEEIKQFDCKQSCRRCGLCVSMAQRHGLAISTAEMDDARRRFLAGQLEIDGVRYAPNPQRLAALRRALGRHLFFTRLVPPPLQFKPGLGTPMCP